MHIASLRLLVLLVSGCLLSAATPLRGAAPGTPGGADWREGLTDRELMISRWFSQLTCLQERGSDPWPEWHDDGKQLGITSLR